MENQEKKQIKNKMTVADICCGCGTCGKCCSCCSSIISNGVSGLYHLVLFPIHLIYYILRFVFYFTQFVFHTLYRIIFFWIEHGDDVMTFVDVLRKVGRFAIFINTGVPI